MCIFLRNKHIEAKALFGSCFLELFVKTIICKHIEHNCGVFQKVLLLSKFSVFFVFNS